MLSCNRGTSAMHTHRNTCRRWNSIGVAQSKLEFVTRKRKGIAEVAKFVYDDHILICKVIGPTTLQKLYRNLGFDKVTYDSVNGKLTESYNKIVEKIKRVLTKRTNSDVISLSFAKWTSTDKRKFFGLYCYFRKESFCLGLIHYEGSCCAAQMLEDINRQSQLFGISMNDVDVLTLDCGSDVCKVARLAQKFLFPCLCHMINLIVKRFVLNLDLQTLESDDVDEYNDEQFDDVVQKTRRFVAKVKNSPLLEDRLGKIQIEMSGSSLKLIRDNATRWNSFLDMLVRFLHLRTYLKVIDVEGDLEMCNWEALHKLINVLQPLKDITHELQKKSSNAKTAVDAINYLRMVASREATVQQPIKEVLSKRKDRNSLVEGLI